MYCILFAPLAKCHRYSLYVYLYRRLIRVLDREGPQVLGGLLAFAALSIVTWQGLRSRNFIRRTTQPLALYVTGDEKN